MSTQFQLPDGQTLGSDGAEFFVEYSHPGNPDSFSMFEAEDAEMARTYAKIMPDGRVLSREVYVGPWIEVVEDGGS